MKQTAPLIIGGAIFALLVWALLSAGGSNALDRSALGTEGLYRWLKTTDTTTARSHRRTSLSEDDIALRIMPLYDMNLQRSHTPAETTKEARSDTTISDINRYTLINKVAATPTLVALPKWRRGVLELDLLHEQFLISTSSYDRLLDHLSVPGLKLERPDLKLLQEDGLTIYRPQVFSKDSLKGSCKPVRSIPQGVLIVFCQAIEPHGLWVLSDPDLINNHGLSLGKNAEFAASLPDIAPRGGITYIDTSDQMLLSNPQGTRQPERERTSEDVSRFLTYPFSLIWIGAGLVLLIAIWRGLIRFGPAIKLDDGRLAASKTAAIESKAYLLRLTGQDHALVQDFAQSRMGDLARDVLGKQAATDALFKRLSALAPDKAADLKTALNRLDNMPPETNAQTLAKAVQDFDDTYRSIKNELGHVSRRR